MTTHYIPYFILHKQCSLKGAGLEDIDNKTPHIMRFIGVNNYKECVP